jgi:uracil phosphoribosyltransferase
MIKELGRQNSILSQFIAEVRDQEIQTDSLRFRKNFERMGEIFAYEISKTLEYENKEVTTQFGIANTKVLKEQPVIATLLRAGLPLHQGLLNIFDKATNAFASVSRKYEKDGFFDLKFGYLSSPGIDDKVLIVSDALIASGSSMVLTYRHLLQKGNPQHIHIVSAIASTEGIAYIKKHLPNRKLTIWLGAIDDELTAKSYIVPGLGDAGDLAFGEKL